MENSSSKGHIQEKDVGLEKNVTEKEIKSELSIFLLSRGNDKQTKTWENFSAYFYNEIIIFQVQLFRFSNFIHSMLLHFLLKYYY